MVALVLGRFAAGIRGAVCACLQQHCSSMRPRKVYQTRTAQFYFAGARSDFVLFIERLQYRWAPACYVQRTAGIRTRSSCLLPDTPHSISISVLWCIVMCILQHPFECCQHPPLVYIHSPAIRWMHPPPPLQCPRAAAAVPQRPVRRVGLELECDAQLPPGGRATAGLSRPACLPGGWAAGGQGRVEGLEVECNTLLASRGRAGAHFP